MSTEARQGTIRNEWEQCMLLIQIYITQKKKQTKIIHCPQTNTSSLIVLESTVPSFIVSLDQ